MADVSVVVLTMGNRPAELAAAIRSARTQRGVHVEVVLVVNGGEPDCDDADIVIGAARNLGIPGGRNTGLSASSAPIVVFLDDDGQLHDGVLAAISSQFVAEPDLAVIGLRVVDPDGGTARRHVPGLRKDSERSRPATSFPGGASAVRRSAFEEVGGLCEPFVYGLEETDLAWRLLDARWSIVYRADLCITHPRTSPTRHPEFFANTARNRVWLAHRALPLPLAIAYVGTWLGITVVRNVSRPTAVRAHLRGTRDGLRRRIGPRRPMRWSTAMRMARLGRPPIV